jgi:O-antigen/teichoic acid export membrane protein
MFTVSETTVGGIAFKKKSRMHIWIAAGACLTNIVGNSLLVPIYGGRGAAISTGISYIVFFTLRTLISNYYFYIDYKLKKYYIITALVIIYALYNTFNKLDIVSFFGYIVCIIMLFILYKRTFIEGMQIVKSKLKIMKS